MSRTLTAQRPGSIDDAFAAARQVADVMLFEGYVLYPYRASARKNQLRWQFGVLMPRDFAPETGEHSASRTECLVEASDEATVHVQVRFLQAQRRDVQAVDGDRFAPAESLSLADRDLVPWDEGIVCERDVDVGLADVIDGVSEYELQVPGGVDVEEVHDQGRLVGRLVCTREMLTARLRLTAHRLEGPYGGVRLTVVLENTAGWPPATEAAEDGDRSQALRHALVAAHLLAGVTGGSFLSLLDPPEWARPAADACCNEHTWPVLVGAGGRGDVVLSSPIILYDHPQVAPESPGDLHDATEIDEILSLRTMALTDTEKREARGTDPRAAAVVDRVDAMPAEVLDRLHGTIRYLSDVTGSVPPARDDVPWWDPGADSPVSPETDAVVVAGRRVARGSKVRLRPRLHGSDAQDVFLVGRVATVEAVLTDVDDDNHLAVTLDDDPGADLQRAEGRYLYFRPEEVELP